MFIKDKKRLKKKDIYVIIIFKVKTRGKHLFKFNEVLSENKVKSLSSIVLAFVGDAVYSLFVREKLVAVSDAKTGELNKLSSQVVCAKAQAKKIDNLFEILTDEEKDIFKRARNAKKGAKAKNASVVEYNKSTGFEAVVGYLYLLGRYDRLDYLLNYEVNDEN